MKFFCSVMSIVTVICAGATEDSLLSIARQRDEDIRAFFTPEHTLPGAEGVQRALLNFSVDGLKQYALVVTPAQAPPNAGFPVLIMVHGHVPEPADYARIEDGSTWRPGIYYRGLPSAYAQRGFMVIVPDLRGHNASEGYRYTSGFLASAWYTRDVLATVSAVQSLETADENRVYVWGHSLGGEISLRALLSRPDIKAASLWSTVYGPHDRRVRYYSMSADEEGSGNPANGAEAVNRHQAELAATGANPAYHIHLLQVPLVIHHARNDRGTPFQWSMDLVAELRRQRKPYRFFRYTGSEHLFKEQQRSRAIDRDVAFFMRHP